MTGINSSITNAPAVRPFNSARRFVFIIPARHPSIGRVRLFTQLPGLPDDGRSRRFSSLFFLSAGGTTRFLNGQSPRGGRRLPERGSEKRGRASIAIYPSSGVCRTRATHFICFKDVKGDRIAQAKHVRHFHHPRACLTKHSEMQLRLAATLVLFSLSFD